MDPKSRGKRKENLKKYHKPRSHTRGFDWDDHRTPPKFRTNHPNGHHNSIIKRHFDRISYIDQINYKATGSCVTEPILGKTAAPRYNEHWEPRNKLNNQNHYQNKISKKTNTQRGSGKCVYLPKIYKKLWLSNLVFADTFDPKKYSFDIIINLSGEKIAKVRQCKSKLEVITRCKIYNFYIGDRRINQRKAKKIIEETSEIIHKAKRAGQCVLVNCHGGVNRSSFVCIAYALEHRSTFNPFGENSGLHFRNPVEYWVKYIQNEKAKVNISWDTLTNRSFIWFLAKFLQK